ncbi:MAG: nucleotidyltransferase family protein [Actinobacteria bacterium]|nr:nucleotidyltransferase family protein [Actinomycetota bacterium]
MGARCGSAAAFLLRATGYRFGDEKAAAELARSSVCLEEPEQRRALLRHASYHELEPLLHAVEEDCARLRHPLVLPGEVREEWAAAFTREGARAALIQLGAERALSALARGGIEVIALKGFYLAARCYERKGARGFRDLDLLVREGDLPGLHRSLLDAGFVPAPERPSFVPAPAYTVYALPLAESGMAMEIDVHIGMHWPAEYERRTSLRVSDIWDRALEEESGALSFSAMCPEHLAITTLLDLAVNHRYARLVKFRDLLEILRSRELDWDMLADQARSWRVRSFVAPGLLYLRSIDLACGIPDGLIDSLLPDYASMRCFLRALPPEAIPAHRSRSFSPANLLFFLLADEWPERCCGAAHIPGHLARGRHRF